MTSLVNLMFQRNIKFSSLMGLCSRGECICGGGEGGGGGAYILDVNLVSYLGGAYVRQAINRILQYMHNIAITCC